MVLPASHGISRVPWYSGSWPGICGFRLQDYHLVSWSFPALFDYPLIHPLPCPQPHTSMVWALSLSLAATQEIEFFFLFLGVLRCFSSPGLPLITYELGYECLKSIQAGFPIRKSPDQCLFATPRSISVLIPSFIGSWCQGIRPMLLITWPSYLFIVFIDCLFVICSFQSTMYTFSDFRLLQCSIICIDNVALSWWTWVDSNHRPHAYQACALTTWATSPYIIVFIKLPWTFCVPGRLIAETCFVAI